MLVDELTHTNVPGSERDKRWQDVEMLLLTGIDVYSTLNIQHLEPLDDNRAIAQRLGIGEGTVRSRTQAALVWLTATDRTSRKG